MPKDATAVAETAPAPRHGKIFRPQSRAEFLVEAGDLPDWQANELEGGKFFPETRGDLPDPTARTDVKNSPPPADGLIASGGHTDARAKLNEPGTQWRKHDVKSGQELTISWSHEAPHKTRRWNYFLTRDGWDPQKPLSREQFEQAPFAHFANTYEPYWGADAENQLMPPDPTNHKLALPPKNGYHVLLAIWEVADTRNAFYQVIDLDFKER